MEISEPVFDRLSFEHYIRLEDSYKYNILLLCRITAVPFRNRRG